MEEQRRISPTKPAVIVYVTGCRSVMESGEPLPPEKVTGTAEAVGRVSASSEASAGSKTNFLFMSKNSSSRAKIARPCDIA